MIEMGVEVSFLLVLLRLVCHNTQMSVCKTLVRVECDIFMYL